MEKNKKNRANLSISQDLKKDLDEIRKNKETTINGVLKLLIDFYKENKQYKT